MKKNKSWPYILLAVVLLIVMIAAKPSHKDSVTDGWTQITSPPNDLIIGILTTERNPGLTEPDAQETVTDSEAYADSENLDFTLNPDGKSYSVARGAFVASVLKIPASHNGLPVTEIAPYAFYTDENITTLHLPDSIRVIGESAFYCCERLTEIEIPDSVTSIGNHAFMGCVNARTLIIGGGVREMGVQAFFACENLQKVRITDGVTVIGTSAFSECFSLRDIRIPASVTEIGAFAFDQCSDLAHVELPAGFSLLAIKTFGDCKSLESIQFIGTVDAWYALPKETYWNLRSAIHTIFCTDGEVPIG